MSVIGPGLGFGALAMLVGCSVMALSCSPEMSSDATVPVGAGPGLSDAAETATQALRRGRDLREAADLAGARRAFERAIELDPTDPDAHAALRAVAEAEGRTDEAAALRDSEEFWLRIAGRGEAVEPNPTVATERFERGLELLREASISLGYQAIDRAKLERAIAAIEEAIDLAPNDDEYQYTAGYAWSLKHEYDRALARLHQAADLNPRRADVPAALGSIRLAQGRFDEARGLFERALHLDDEDGRLQYQYGTCLEQQGELVPACRAYLRAAHLDPVEVEPYLRLANLLSRLGRRQRGALRLADFEWWTRERDAFALWEGDRSDLAGDKLARWSTYLEETIAGAEAPEIPRSKALTYVLSARKQFAQAQAWMQRTLRRKRQVMLLAEFAALCDHVGDPDQALTFLARAMKFEPEHAELRIQHAEHLLRTGRRKEALEQYRTLAAGDPENPWLRSVMTELGEERP